jgi:hypothetical protein
LRFRVTSRGGVTFQAAMFPAGILALLPLMFLVAFLAVLLAGCAGQSSPHTAVSHTVASHPAGQPTASPHPAATSTAQPVTASAADASALAFFQLYTAGQWNTTWQLLTPRAQRIIPKNVWSAVHKECSGATLRTRYLVTHPVVSGHKAFVRVALGGGAARLEHGPQKFCYIHGLWRFSPTDLAVYRDHSAAQAVAKAKALGLCA